MLKKSFNICLLVIATIIFSCNKADVRWNLKKLPEIESDLEIISNNLEKIDLAAILIHNGYVDSSIQTGFCWSENLNPTIDDNVLYSGFIEKGEFNISISWDTTMLSKYVRAFAQNEIGVNYSNEIQIFWPVSGANLPEVQTNDISNVDFFSASVSGSLLSDGGIPWTTRGILISQNSNPTVQNSLQYPVDQANNDFSVDVNELEEDQLYHARAYAVNNAGVHYGEIKSFSTLNFYEIGETGPSGGVIFHNKLDTIGGWNFLEVHTSDFSNEIPWGLNTTSIQTSLELGSGESNTNFIFQSQGASSSYAALACLQYVHQGYNDWFLPSRDELILIYENLYVNGIGFFTPNATYWSSSQDQTFPQNAWTVSMKTPMDNNYITNNKSTLLKVRPIRKF